MKNILLAISGLTPQIVTETFFALTVKNNIIIDEIFIVTTQRGKTVIEGKDKSNKTPNVALKKEIINLCKDLEIKVPKFNINKHVIVAEEESKELYDIKTDKENKLFPNKIAEIIKSIAEDNNTTIYASLSGGRKSMSAHLALALSLFARPQDKLYHVITDEQFEFNNFYPKSRKEERALVLAEIPFVKLRSLNAPILKSDLSYSQIVSKTQNRLKFLTENLKLIIDVADRKIVYGDKQVNLEPMEIALYLKFVERKISKQTGYKISEINREKKFANELGEFLTENYNQHFDKNDKKHWHQKGIDAETFRTKRSKINKKLEKLFSDNDTLQEFKIASKRAWGDTVYIINAPKDKLGVNYE